MNTKKTAGFIAVVMLILSLSWSSSWAENEKIEINEDSHIDGTITFIDAEELGLAKERAVISFLKAHPELVPKFYDLITVLTNVEELYVDKKTEEELLNLALTGMIDGLDPYSNLFVDEGAAKVRESEVNEKEYAGIGVVFVEQRGEFVIISVLKNSPAQKAGLQPGDVIIGIDGKNTRGLKLNELGDLIRGKENATVSLEIRSKRLQKPTTFKITRQTVVFSSVETAQYGDFGYIKINGFVSETADRVREALALFKDEKGLILDIRNNGGGLVSSVQEVIGLFVGPDKLIATLKGRTEDEEKVKTDVPKQAYPQKVAVLTNNYSASASEILAGNLQYYKVAKIIGIRTFGKAVVQTLYELDFNESGAARLFLILTTDRYFLPDGRNITETGIVPDIEVYQSEEFKIYEYGTEKDTQFQKALEFLRQK